MIFGPSCSLPMTHPLEQNNTSKHGMLLYTYFPVHRNTNFTTRPLRIRYGSGMTSKEGLQQVPNVDPFVVVKTPRLYRTYPVGLHTHPWLRSTWALRNGQWTKIENRVDPSLGESRFDVWAERAVFQFHPIPETATPIVRIRPRLELSIADLFHPQTIDHPTFVNVLNEHQVSVTNVLLRIVHGGVGC